MNRLNGKHIVLGVTGGIAAYKSADLTRRLMEAGAQVRIVMTSAATEFVTPLTFQALSGHAVFFDQHSFLTTEQTDSNNPSAADGMKHIELARWADAIIIAPASANTIEKLAHGRADNLLTTLCLASEAIKCFAPAMNRVMWNDLSTQSNCKKLIEKSWQQFGPASGLQACGETGEGRMLEVSDILSKLHDCFESGELQGLNLVVTAGPTYEAIDPVRFIGNRSSGRMGYAIATAAQEAGANVTLISGPCHLPGQLQNPDVSNFISIESAAEMQQAVFENIEQCDIYISAAAVSDYRVNEIATQKIKKDKDALTLQLTKNDDIISAVAALRSPPYVVGFAAETENIEAYAKDKLVKKNLDMIIANDVSSTNRKTNSDDKEPEKSNTEKSITPKIGFNSEYNALQVYWRQDKQSESPITEQQFSVARKSLLAKQLISLIAEQYTLKQKSQNAQNTA